MPLFLKLYYDDLPHRAVSVYMYLHDRANKNMQCYPAVSTIAADLSLSASTVKRAMRDLEAAGYIKREPRFRGSGAKSSNLYTVVR